MRFLALCTGYPQQVEMLLKAGMFSAVDDMVRFGKLNKKLFDWNEKNVYRSFGLEKDVLQEWLDGGCSQNVLEAYKRMTKASVKATMPELKELETISRMQFERLTQGMTRHGLSAERMLHYIEKQGGTAEKKWHTAELWNDYIHAAERIGYDLTNPVFLLPKELSAAHDKATRAYVALKKDIKNSEYRDHRLKN